MIVVVVVDVDVVINVFVVVIISWSPNQTIAVNSFPFVHGK